MDGVVAGDKLKAASLKFLQSAIDGKFDWKARRAQKTGKLKLGSCIEKLFDKVCLEPGEVRYGGWDSNTIRLIDGRVEQAGRDLVFRPLVTQQPGCRLPIAD